MGAIARPDKAKKPKPIHFSEMLKVIENASKFKQQVDVKVWRSRDGAKLRYKNWYVASDYWRGGWCKLRNPKSGAIRLVPEILIFEINNHKVYL